MKKMSNRNAGTWNTMEKSRHAGTQRSVDLTAPASSTLRTPVHGRSGRPTGGQPAVQNLLGNLNYTAASASPVGQTEVLARLRDVRIGDNMAWKRRCREE